MLIRLEVHGFKNLRDVEVSFGPVTCFVGRNGVGKSNIFDAMQFLRLLSEHEIQEAAELVRSPSSGGFGPLDLFWSADGSTTMRFVADMLVPRQVVDDFGVETEPSTNLLRYTIAFRHVADPRPRLELTEERLVGLKKGESRRLLGFTHAAPFRDSSVKSSHRRGDYISTETVPPAQPQIMLHQDGGSRGRPVNPGKSPRTVLGGTNTADYPTVLAARREMGSWHSLHLEPSSLRAPDAMGAREHVSERGSHIAASLQRLNSRGANGGMLAEAANRLSELVPEVESLRIDEDRPRQQLTVQARMKGSDHWLGPRALSDGTLRFLALVAMQMDPTGSRVLLMEEPENGIHPSRVPAMVNLLRDYAVDPELAVGEDNPLRQVVVNSHSPEVVKQLMVSEVLFVDAVRHPDGTAAEVSAVEGGWRRTGPRVSIRRLEAILGGAPLGPDLASRQLTLFPGTAE